MAWTLLGTVSPERRLEARLQLHYAAQIVSAGAVTLLEPAADDSHPNLGWDSSLSALVGRPLGASGARLALEIEGFAVMLLDADGGRLASIELDGKQFDDVFSETARALERADLLSASQGLHRTPYELPPHPVADGAAFARPDGDVLGELAAWLEAGFIGLEACASANPGSAEVRVWPHHFDAGSIFAVDTAPDGTARQTIGFGMSPGDGAFAEPYWYVSPWPAPEALPGLDAPGHWHLDGFTAAVLTASEMDCSSAEAQHAGVAAFLERSVTACRTALERSHST